MVRQRAIKKFKLNLGVLIFICESELITKRRSTYGNGNNRRLGINQKNFCFGFDSVNLIESQNILHPWQGLVAFPDKSGLRICNTPQKANSAWLLVIGSTPRSKSSTNSVFVETRHRECGRFFYWKRQPSQTSDNNLLKFRKILIYPK
jgi:hypothetical protein